MFNKLGIQIWTVRELIKDYDIADVVFRKLSEYGYSEMHVSGSYGITEPQVAELCTKYGISIMGTHNPYDRIINDVEGTLRLHEMYGTKNVGIGCMPADARKSLADLKDFIKTFNETAEIYAKHGYKTTYHNHHFEFLRIDGNKTVMDYLYEGFDKDNITFVLDTCWVAAGTADVCEWMEKLQGRMDILHLKDVFLQDQNGVLTGSMTEVGNGNIAWKRVIDTAKKVGIKHYIVEQDANFIDNHPLKSAKVSADFLKPYMDK